MKKESSAHKHKPSELSTHPTVPSPKALHPHLAHISPAVLLPPPDPGTDLGDGPSCSLPFGQGQHWSWVSCPVLWTLSKGRWPGPPVQRSSVNSQHCSAALRESAAEQWEELTFCSLRAPLLFLPQNRKGCEVLTKVGFQNSSSSQRGWLIQGLGSRAGDVAWGGSWNGAQLGWEPRERKWVQGKGQARLLQLLKLFLPQLSLLFSSPIRCAVAPNIQGYCTGEHSSLLPCYHPHAEKLLCQNQRERYGIYPWQPQGKVWESLLQITWI